MTRFRNIFTTRHTLLPVIHVEDFQQAYRNVVIAGEAGCSGAFLISHDQSLCDFAKLSQITKTIHSLLPDFWLGVNFLDRPTNNDCLYSAWAAGANGIWVDNAHISTDHGAPQAEAANFQYLLAYNNYEKALLYFGGVAFKYQEPVEDVARAALIATEYMDVVTTSGAGTGQAASVDKIKTMKGAIGNFPLAIASGVSPQNIAEYRDYADCFLVSTGISKRFTELDICKVKDLADQLELK